MPPKGRKSLNHSWYTCDSCSVLLTHKDLQQHQSDSCPPDYSDWKHPFIKDSVLFSFIEYSNVNDVPKLRLDEIQSFVYMSQSAMQLCHLEIGEQVLLSINKEESVIKTVWPTTEKTLTSVILAPMNSGTAQKPAEDCNRVKVIKLLRKPNPATYVSVACNANMSLRNIDELLLFCKQKYLGKVLLTGSKIVVPFYGKNVTLTIKSMTQNNIKEEDSMIHHLEELSIDNDRKDIYYVIVETTKWEIYQNIKNNEKHLTFEKQNGLNEVGGYKEIVDELLRSVSLVVKRTHSSTHVPSSLGILLHGPNGVGKTYIVEALAHEMNVPVIKVKSGELFSKFYGETELRLHDLFYEARNKSSSIIILDNVDIICSNRGGTELERRVSAYLLTLIDSLKDSETVVLATTSQLNLVNPSLRRPGRLDYEVEVPVPSVSDRYEMLKVMLSDWTVEDAVVRNVALAAHGFVAADLRCLVTKAVMQASLHNTSPQAFHLDWALSQIKPSAMREIQVQVPNVKWTDIGGMDDLKLKLQQSIEWPLRHPESFTRLGIKPPRGVLMYGPPGCSKTMIAKALATESKLNFISIKGSDLFSKWVGESEKAVQSLFKKARAVAPSIIFLDELDALGGERSGSSEGSNVQERVLAQLLTEMDGVEPLINVNIVAATNRPDRIDKALLRPGRFDRMVYVPLPDLATRICILQLQLVKMPVADNIVIDDLAMKTEGYSGAEVVAVCHEAAINALQEDFNVPEVCERHFVSALNIVKPRTPLSLIKLYNNY